VKILIATNNKGKLREIREILSTSQIEAVSLSQADVSGDPIEDADTFLGNAIIKARYFAKLTGMPAIADDSGLCVDALNGAPGVKSARFAGENATDKANNALMLKKLETVDDALRTAHFECVMVCVGPDDKLISAQGKSEGVILRAPRGENGFGYDPLFLVPKLGKTFAELEPTVKHSISHRGRALKKLAARLVDFLD